MSGTKHHEVRTTGHKRTEKKVDEIIILPADKGKATVVLDKDEYEEKVTTMLGDKKTYEQLPNDPTPKYKWKLVATLGNLKKEGKITESKYKELYPTAENVPRLQGCIQEVPHPGDQWVINFGALRVEKCCPYPPWIWRVVKHVIVTL